MVRTQHIIEFRPISVSDAANLVRWQREPEVSVWWGDNDIPDDELLEKWSTRADGSGTDYDRNTHCYIIVVDGVDVGEIQGYELRHYREHNDEVGVANSAGVDLFIGESGWRDRGVGTQALRQFLSEKIFSIPGVDTCTIDPDPDNKRAIRSYGKVGFRHLKTYYSNANKMNCYLMRLDRGEFESSEDKTS